MRLERITEAVCAIGLMTRTGSSLPTKSRSHCSSTKLKLIVSCQPRSASAWRSAVGPRRVSLSSSAVIEPLRRVCRKRVVADEANHLFDQVGFDAKVEAPAWRHDLDASGQGSPREAEARHHALALRLRERHADHLGRARDAKHDRRRRRQRADVIVDRSAASPGVAADVDDQGRDALEMQCRRRRVDAALESMASIGRKIEAARTAGDGFGPPERSFDVDVARRIRDRRRRTAHDAGERLDANIVGDHAHRAVELDRAAVEQLERLAGAAPPHVQAAFDLVEVEHMRRPAELEHHVVRDVDQRRHAALPAARQPVDHPCRRLGLRLDAANHAAREAAAQVGRFDGHANARLVVDLHGGDRRCLQRRAGQRGDFTRHAEDAQRVAEIGRELEREDGIVEREHRAQVGADRRGIVEHEQAAVIVGELELARGAQHAAAFDAADLADLDAKRLRRLAFARRRQLGTDERARHLDAGANVGRAADDGKRLRRADVDHAQAQSIGIRVRLDRAHRAHDDAMKRRRHCTYRFDLEPRHGQALGQLGRADRRIAELAQPGFRELHVRPSSRTAARMDLAPPWRALNRVSARASSIELAQEAQVAVEEQTQIVDAVTQHGEPVDARAEREADHALGIEAHVANDLRMHLPGA